MHACTVCARENPGDARFCNACGSPLPPPVAAREARKTVTVLFSDVTGSTSLGERLDPEAVRRVMGRWFEAARAELERHGATVEKFVGDAVMAVFGVPRIHEDDALRAVRAASGLRSAIERVNAELERDHGVRIEVRTGVNTGEVVAGEGETLATGDAVNVAARLEQAAAPGDVLLGATTLALVRDAVETVPVEPLAVKGKTEPVRAHRLVSVRGDAQAFARRLDAPLVGREGELAQLRHAYERAARGRRAVLFTLLGSAGIGKSRLAEELLRELGGEATVLRGRCLPYGEGITYWPLAEMLAGTQPAELLREEAHGALAAERVAGALGSGGEAGSPEETAWAVRKLLERLARERPLLVVLDDLHWAEPTFLDLVDHVADWSRGAPIVLLCLARPELLEARPGWGGGKLNAGTVLLEPLSDGESQRLVDTLVAADQLAAGTRARIAEAAEGNPLFVEQMLAMLREGGGEDTPVPPTITALLAARLDRLDPGERTVLEHAAVEGKLFHRDALSALVSPELRSGLDAHLLALVRKELISPGDSALTGGDAFGFRHQLVRDVAYESLPKQARARLHERFADWLEAVTGVAGDLDEIRGYHLEQAVRYRAELGPPGEAETSLARRAALLLLSGGRSALARHDVPAARALLERAVALLAEDDPLRPEALLELVGALTSAGEFVRARTLVSVVAAGSDERLRARAQLAELELGVFAGGSLSEALADAANAAELLERTGDVPGAASARLAVGRHLVWLGRAEQATGALRSAAELARGAGERRLEGEAAGWLFAAAALGPTPVGEALSLFDELEAVIPASDWSRGMVMQLVAAQGRFDEARSGVASVRATIAELGHRVTFAGSAAVAAVIEVYAGDLGAAERVLRDHDALLASLGEIGYRSTVAAMLADVLARQRRGVEAEAVLDEISQFVAQDDFEPQVRLRSTRARVAAQRGDHAAAVRWAQEAVDLASATDYVEVQAEAALALAEVLQAGPRVREAARQLERALELYENKGIVVMARRTRTLLEELRAGP